MFKIDMGLVNQLTKGDKIKIDCGMYWGNNKEQIFSLFHKKPIE
jgi:hypothetical protein